MGGSAGTNAEGGVGGSLSPGAEAGAGATPSGSGGLGGSSVEMCTTGASFMIARPPESTPPAIVLVLDASATTTLMAPSGGSVWDNTAAAVNDVVSVLPDGLPVAAISFPDLTLSVVDSCSTITRVPLAPLDEQQRQQLRDVLPPIAQPHGLRDLEQGYELALATPAGSTPAGHEAIVVVTTGLPSHDLDCEPFERPPTRADVAPLFDAVEQARAMGIDTYVIGSYGSLDDADVLSDLALAAGTPSEPCKDQGAEDYCHFDISWSSDVRGQLDVVLWKAVRDELLRSGCRFTLPSLARPPSTLSLVSAGGITPLGPASGDVRCQDGWELAAVEPSDGDASSAVTLCTSTCFDYLADPTAQIVACADLVPPHL